MQDLLRSLILDTQLLLKGSLDQKSSFLVSQEEYVVCTPKSTPSSPRDKASLSPSKPITSLNPVLLREKKASSLPPARSMPPPESIVSAEKHSSPSLQTTYSPSSIRSILSRVIPDLPLTDLVPDDSIGRKISGSWKERILDATVVLLACDSDPDTTALLKSLAKAIDTHLAKTKILSVERLEKESTWDLFLSINPLQLILASAGFHKLKVGKSFHREVPSKQTHFLNQIPFLPLLPANQYKQVHQKALLWKTLCQILKT